MVQSSSEQSDSVGTRRRGLIRAVLIEAKLVEVNYGVEECRERGTITSGTVQPKALTAGRGPGTMWELPRGPVPRKASNLDRSKVVLVLVPRSVALRGSEPSGRNFTIPPPLKYSTFSTLNPSKRFTCKSI
jgi:hypothetical protein